MATNQLLPFANGAGANVETFANWSALAQVSTGFGSGLAVSKYFNYILAQGGAAGYAIGKVVVDWLGQDATIDATTLGTNFEAALDARYNQFGNYLPLAGGTMTGKIVVNGSNNHFISNVSSSSYLRIDGGLGQDYNGGALVLSGKDRSVDAGYFALLTGNGSSQNALQGRPDGTLTWMGYSVETVNASSLSYSVPGGAYIRYKSGLQICYGISKSTNYVTFPAAFYSIPAVTITPYGNGHQPAGITSYSTTGFQPSNGGSWSCFWIAIGRWV